MKIEEMTGGAEALLKSQMPADLQGVVKKHEGLWEALVLERAVFDARQALALGKVCERHRNSVLHGAVSSRLNWEPLRELARFDAVEADG